MVGLRPLKVYIALNKVRSLGYLGNLLLKYTAWYLKLGPQSSVFIYYWYEANVCNLDSDWGILVSVGKAGLGLFQKVKPVFIRAVNCM